MMVADGWIAGGYRSFFRLSMMIVADGWIVHADGSRPWITDGDCS